MLHELTGDCRKRRYCGINTFISLIFLDSASSALPGMVAADPPPAGTPWPAGGVTDNAISHRSEDGGQWMNEVGQDPAFATSLVPVGKGVASGAMVVRL